MSVRRVVESGLLVLAAAACAPQTGANAPRPVMPQDGPKTSIRATYSGGLMYRTVEATFSVDQMSFVLVGHLGGDGMIRVLHPASAASRGLVSAKKTMRVPAFQATYDGAPRILSSGVMPFRNVSSKMDSYDGRGHGFIFIIASRRPFDFREISDGFDFDELEVANYHQVSDPRLAISGFAQQVAGGPFTLKFANAFSTVAFTSYAARAWDCSVLAASGYGPMFGYSFGYRSMFGSWGVPSLWLGRSGGSYDCGSRYAHDYDPFWRTRRLATGIPTTGLPVGPITPTLTRPPRRPITAPGRAVVFDGRSSIERPSPVTRGSRTGPAERRSAHRPADNETRQRVADRPARREDGGQSERPRATSTEATSRPSSSAGERPAARPAETPRMTAPAREAPREAPRPAPAAEPTAEKRPPGT